ncbi:MAG: ABC transporter permease subunit [Candidatus Lokiarchaeota archaeon]|nr:ABC transporter permease subunit [Candidatus Lokiarchaeota archaeon]
MECLRMGLREYVIRRSIYMFLLVVAVVCFNFFLFRLPTLVLDVSPVDLMISEELRRNLTRQALAELYQRFGLVPDPDIFDWIYMFWRYLVNMFTGNFGLSFWNQQPVMDEIMERLPNTLLLMGTSSIVSIILGIWTGVKVAADPGSRKDVSAVTLALFIYSLPIFWLGMMLLMIFAFYVPELTGGLIGFPLGKTITQPLWGVAKASPLGGLWLAADILHHLFLPMIALGVGGYGGYFLYMRNNLIDVMTEDYILTARAKGLDENQVLYKHGLKNAMLPMVTIIAMTFGFLINGATLTETVFNWNGLGRYIFDSLFRLDYPVVQAIFMIIAITAILANFVADLLYGVLDPRIKYG